DLGVVLERIGDLLLLGGRKDLARLGLPDECDRQRRERDRAQGARRVAEQAETKARLRPMRSPTLLPIRMKAAGEFCARQAENPAVAGLAGSGEGGIRTRDGALNPILA